MGYDNSIREALHISDNKDDKNTTIFMGFRIVQPHNFVLNLLLRYGLIFTLIYIYILIKVLSIYVNDKDNLAIIICYLFANMFMHSLLSGVYLLYLIYVLRIKNQSHPLYAPSWSSLAS